MRKGVGRQSSIVKLAAVWAWGAASLLPRPAEGDTAASCPDRVAVMRALTALSPPGQAKAPVPEEAISDLKVEDLGPRYRVTARGRSREYDDADRDCERRAHVAAVFVALVLSPSRGDADASSGSSTPAAAGSSSALSPPRAEPSPPLVGGVPAAAGRDGAAVGGSGAASPSSSWYVAAGPALSLALHDHAILAVPGAELGVTWARGAWGVALGASVPFVPAHLEVGPVVANLSRYPAHLAFDWQWRAAPFAGALEAGLLVAALRARQRDDPAAATATRIETGAWLSLRAGLRLGAVTPYARIFSELVPRPYPLALDPDGPLGETPTVWFGVAAGIAVALD